MSSSAAELGIWRTIADEAGWESALWAAALRPAAERDETPIFSALAPESHGLGLESIYEGYLLHYGRPRLFAPADSDTAMLLGDYLYAHGLVRVAAHGDVAVVADLAELVSLCAQLRAEERAGDGAAWAGTVTRLGADDPRLETARAALRLNGDPAPLLALAELEAGAGAVGRSLALHAERVDPRSRRQVTRPAVAGELPDGVMIRAGGAPGLLAGGGMLPWTFAGYQAPVPLPPATPVELLTPPATVATIAAGYRPLLHPSAAAVHGLRVLRR